MISFRSIRRWLLGIEERLYQVSPVSYPARITHAKSQLCFTLHGHTLVAIDTEKTKSWPTKDLIAEFDRVLSSRFGLNSLAWDYEQVDTFLRTQFPASHK